MLSMIHTNILDAKFGTHTGEVTCENHSHVEVVLLDIL